MIYTKKIVIDPVSCFEDPVPRVGSSSCFFGTLLIVH